MATKKKTKAVASVKTAKVSVKKASLLNKLPVKSVNWKMVSKVAFVILVGIALFLLAKKYRGLVLAGIVNKTPISRFELNQTLASRYGKATFEEMVNNELLKQEAAKMSVEVTAQDISDQIKELQDKIGGEAALKDALLQYGLTQSQLEDQIRTSVLQKKMAEKLGSFEVTVEEAEKYFKENAVAYADKKFEEVKDEVISMLKDQKMQEAFNTWFVDVRAKAQIQSYLD